MEELNAPGAEPLVGRAAMAGPAITEALPERATDMDMVGNPPAMVPLPSLEELIWMGVQEVHQLHKSLDIGKAQEFRVWNSSGDAEDGGTEKARAGIGTVSGEIQQECRIRGSKRPESRKVRRMKLWFKSR